MSDVDRAVAVLTGTMREAVVERLRKLGADIGASIVRHGLRASGRTQASIRVVTDAGGVSLVGRRYFPALQFGNGPWRGGRGERSSFYAFRAVIAEWARAKGLVFGQAKEQERAVSAITASIIRSGTRLYRSGGRLDVYDTLNAEAAKDIEAMPATFGAKAVDIIINKWAGYRR